MVIYEPRIISDREKQVQREEMANDRITLEFSPIIIPTGCTKIFYLTLKTPRKLQAVSITQRNGYIKVKTDIE
jgi:hypothetical protein